jgi:Transposase
MGGGAAVAHRKKKIGAQLVEDEEYQLRYERVAGIDVAKGKADVCTRLPPARDGGRRVSRSEEVTATVTAILALAARLLADGVELVSMESTSDYWRVWFYVLEAAGLNVQLVNSSHARQLAGRPKTDRLDARWLARLTEMGLLRPSFVPPAEIRALRDLTRTRLRLVHDRTREWQRLEKLLEGALVKLSSALSSLARVKSARVIAKRSPAASATPGSWPAWPRDRSGPGARASSRPWRACSTKTTTAGSPASTWTTSRSWTGRSPQSRTTSPRPWMSSPPRRASTPPGPGPRIPAPAPRCSRLRNGSRRSPASAWTSPAPSSPKRAWT